MKGIRRFDLLTTDQQIETSYSFQSNHSKVSENTTINLILGAMNNIFHIKIFLLFNLV